MVLQCASNKINGIFSRQAGLGAAGEAFLVNRQRGMFTDSRFSSDRSTIGQHLSRRDTMAKFQEKYGRKARPGETSNTCGVSTCTAVAISMPGKLSYMCHINNIDRIHGRHTTDPIGRVMERNENFAISAFQRRGLQITLIANHCEAILNSVGRLAERGLFLSQLRFMHHSKSAYASPGS